MQLGQVIRKYRKNKNMTQEEMGGRLGVTAPAVNKWEKGNSYPDITLLAPLARILDTTLDELLSFQKELSDEEVLKLEEKLGKIFESEGYQKGYEACEGYLMEYPNCLCLKLRVGSMLCSRMLLCNVQENREPYQERARELFEEVASGNREDLTAAAKVMLVGHYMGKGEYEKAEQILDGMPDRIYDKNDLYPSLYMQQNKLDKAQEMLENELFQKVNRAIVVLNVLRGIAFRRKDYEGARKYIDKSAELMALFDFHHTTVCEQYLDFYMQMGDQSQALDWLERYLDEFDQISFDYSDSFFFSKIKLNETSQSMGQLRQILAQCLETDPVMEKLRGEERFWRAVKKFCGEKE